MRKIAALILAVMLFACKPIVEEVTTEVHVMNSAWQVVKEDTLVSRALGSLDAIQTDIASYNASHTDDQWFLVEGEIPPVEESPQMDAYICDVVTHDIIKEFIDWPRSSLIEDRAAWRIDTAACAGILYIDNIPPPPVVVVDTRPDYEKYALYLVSAVGVILYETHCEDFADAGYASAEAYFPERRRQFLFQAAADANGEYVIAGRLYP